MQLQKFPVRGVFEREQKEDPLFGIEMSFHTVVFSFGQHAISKSTIFSDEENLHGSNFNTNVLKCHVKNYIPEVQQLSVYPPFAYHPRTA
jgi:hypothetical protein